MTGSKSERQKERQQQKDSIMYKRVEKKSINSWAEV